MAPLAIRIAVNDAASIDAAPRAARHKSELAANPTSANPVATTGDALRLSNLSSITHRVVQSRKTHIRLQLRRAADTHAQRDRSRRRHRGCGPSRRNRITV